MRCVDEGHTYELSDFEQPGIYELEQQVRFIKKELVDGQFVTTQAGTTNEEVLRMLINRIQYLNSKAGCRENSIVVTKLEEALMWLEKRTADRKARGVEGTPAK